MKGVSVRKFVHTLKVVERLGMGITTKVTKKAQRRQRLSTLQTASGAWNFYSLDTPPETTYFIASAPLILSSRMLVEGTMKWLPEKL